MRIISLLFPGYLIFVFYGTLIPFELVDGWTYFHLNVSNAHWVPFWDLSRGRISSIPDMVQNIIFFLPLGAMGWWVFKNRLAMLGFGPAISLIVEICQLFTSHRTTSTTDLATNSIGYWIGLSGMFLFFRFWKGMSKKDQWNEVMNEVSFQKLAWMILFCTVYVTNPFDFSLDAGIVWANVKFLVTQPLHHSWPLKDEPLTFVFFALLGLLGYQWAQNTNLRGLVPALTAISLGKIMLMAGVMFALLLELSQLIIRSRVPSLQDFSASLAGLFFGFVFGMKNHKGWGWMVLTILALLVPIVYLLNPFEFRENIMPVNVMPFLPHYSRTTFEAFSNALIQVLLFLPAGFAARELTEFVRNKKVILVSFLVFFLIAAGCEWLQQWIEGRYPDVTDLLIASLGFYLGKKASGTKVPEPGISINHPSPLPKRDPMPDNVNDQA